MVINCKKPCKKKRSTMLTVEQMVDIALGAPEIGAVNFNILHALIHVIIQQLNIQKCLVEFKGYDSDRMEGIILSAKPGPILKLSEYMIDLSGGKTCSSKDKTSRPRRDEEDAKEDEMSKKEKKKPDEEKEKSDKGKEESDIEEAKRAYKKAMLSDECEDVEEPEVKKVKKVSKPCPCKVPKDTDICPDESLKLEPSSYYGSDSEGACQTIVRVEPVGEKCDSWRSRPALAHESMVKLEEKVAMLQDAFEALERMPTNEELKQKAQGGTCVSTPVKDLWQLYNLNKRVESCEGTIDKMASMIEDLVKETCNMREALLVIADAVDEIECADETGRNCCAALQGRSGAPVATTNTPAPTRPGETQTPTVTFNENNSKLPADKAYTQTSAPQTSKNNKSLNKSQLPCPSCPPQNVSETDKQVPDQMVPEPKPEPILPAAQTPTPTPTPAPTPAPAPAPAPAPPPTPTPTPAPAPAPTPPPTPASVQPSESTPAPASEPPLEPPPPTEKRPVTEPQTRSEALPVSETLNVGMEQGSLIHSGVMGIGSEFNKMSSGEKFCLLKENINCLIAQVRDITTTFPLKQIAAKLCALISMEKQLDTLDKEWRAFCETFNPAGVLQLSPDIVVMKNSIENLFNSVDKLIREKKENENRFQNVSNELDYLTRAKADLELVQDELAGKADAALVNRKVSHDQFDAACDDLTRGLDEALKKLLQQEVMWNEAMEELQRDLENKLDKNDIMPLKEFINKKLKCLQDKLKQLAQMKKDAEAAGAKSRILRNLNCISCDADVIMKMDNRVSTTTQMMSSSKSLKPMLSYQLDQVRKAMKKSFPCRDPASHVEETIVEIQRKNSCLPLTTRDAVEKKMSKLAHFCNRYCGGSHTITTPQQRVTRIGHFLTEFGPQAMTLFNQDLETKSTQEVLTPRGGATMNPELSKPC